MIYVSNSWLPLLFIPTNASPLFTLTFIILNYFLHRPCVYCSLLLLVLFISSCHWADTCFFDLSGSPSEWFAPRFNTYHPKSPPSTDNAGHGSEGGLMSYVGDVANTTAAALAGAAFEEAKKRIRIVHSTERDEWTGIGVEWLRSLLGRREWVLPCVDVRIRL